MQVLNSWFKDSNTLFPHPVFASLLPLLAEVFFYAFAFESLF